MKKLLSILILVVFVMSCAFTTYASAKAKDAESKNNGKSAVVGNKQNKVEEIKVDVNTESKTLGSDIESLRRQLKENHKDKEQRKELIRKIVEIRKQNKNNSIPVFVDGMEVEFDVPPVIKGGRTLIPVRAISNALGATVEWDAVTRTVTIKKDIKSKEASVNEIVIKITLGSDVVMVNGKETKIDVPAQLVSNRTMVPIRFIAEVFKMKVEWDQDNGAVIIENPNEEDVAPTPEVTPEPTPAPTPEVTETPEPTPTPEPAETPEPTATPESTETEEPVTTPEPTPVTAQ